MTIDDIVLPLVKRTEFTIEDIKGESRTERLIIVRYLLFFYLRSFKDEQGECIFKLTDIGLYFNKGHQSVGYGVKNAKDRISRIKSFNPSFKTKDTITRVYVYKLGLNGSLLYSK